VVAGFAGLFHQQVQRLGGEQVCHSFRFSLAVKWM
jgi:hypothetical protein